MPKFPMTDLTNLQNETSVVTAINDNFQAIEDALDDALFREGTAGTSTDNAMDVDLDMNSKRILNLPAPSDPLEAARHGDLQTYVDDAEAAKDAAEIAQTAAELAETNAETAETNAEAAEAAAQDILDEIETYDINTGVSTPVDVGSKSTGTYTPEPSDGVLLRGTNDGAHTLGALTGTGWYRLKYVNGASAGIVTASGWDITLDPDSGLTNVSDGSVIEFFGTNDGEHKVLQVTILLDAT